MIYYRWVWVPNLGWPSVSSVGIICLLDSLSDGCGGGLGVIIGSPKCLEMLITSYEFLISYLFP